MSGVSRDMLFAAVKMGGVAADIVFAAGDDSGFFQNNDGKCGGNNGKQYGDDNLNDRFFIHFFLQKFFNVIIYTIAESCRKNQHRMLCFFITGISVIYLKYIVLYAVLAAQIEEHMPPEMISGPETQMSSSSSVSCFAAPGIL